MSDNLAHFAFDLFLSYGWAGLQGVEDGDRGWVAEFKRVLEGQLSSELGRRARIHLDVEQSKNGELPANLRDAVAGSAAFLSVITPGSCRDGSWCHRELDWFLADTAEILPNRRQLFSVLLRDVKHDLWPEVLRPVVPTNFLNDATPRGPVARRELADAATDGGGRLQALAIQIARVLEQADAQIARTALLACSAPPLRMQVERLATEITKRGGTSMSVAYQDGESEQAFRDRYARALKGASLLVCLIADGESATPSGWSSSIERIQMDGANARFAQQARQVIVWRDRTGPDAADWPNAQVLKSLGFEYLHSLLSETLKSHVAGAAARSAARQQAKADGGASPSGDRKYVFIECAPGDLERLAPLYEALQAKGYRAKFPLFQGDAALRKREDLEFLSKCCAAAVYFGSRGDLEVHLACQAIAETIADHSLSIPRAVLLDPHNDPLRRYFVFPEFTNYPYKPDEFVTTVIGAAL